MNPYYQRLHDYVWTREPRSSIARQALHGSRYALALVRDLVEGEISLRAMSLVYTTLLSLVPLLALSFSVLKALGVHNTLEPLLEQLLRPLGDQSAPVAREIIGFVDNMRVGVLGFLGVVMLLYTAVSMISKIETSFNFIWKVGRTRGMTQRFSEYLVVLLVGPLLVFAAIGITASVRNSALVSWLSGIQPFGLAILVMTKAVPYALIIATLTFVYSYMPNTRVHWRAALIGGLFAGISWESASAAFATFVANANYQAIYSGFAIVIILLVWIYLGWLIVLFGCRLAFYVQFPRFLAAASEQPQPGSREGEFLAMRLLALVAGRFVAGAPPTELDEARRVLGVPEERFAAALRALVSAGVLSCGAEGRQLLPSRDPGSYTLAQLWLWVRGPLLEDALAEPLDRSLREFLAAAESQVDAAKADSVRDWLQSLRQHSAGA